MPLTQLDPVAALVVIDLQQGIVAAPTVHPAAEVIDRSAQLARAFRRQGLPVVLVNVSGPAPGRTDAGPPRQPQQPGWTELVPQLEPQPGDLRITKQRFGAFIGTGLDQELHRRGVTQVFLTGISTSAGVESTARSAHDLGYNVVLVLDATTDRSPELYQHSVEKVFPRLGETAQTGDVLRHLAQRQA
jgi:nicotinamidase-related amidase